ncbi:glycine betaine ABC transporter substrate-binding protein [Marinitoga litoralis]|uniref:glycine betaine ABC transporter substrate-binding protein n=1 Tax=Marinitoga litoralis TaxID=570855 RepID=UPI001961BB2B|nr:osmoprotectant transport system substrate-binding protein [Marinitoga litoralis]
MKKIGVILLLVILSLNVFAAKTVVVGAKMFTEGYVLANMISQLLKNAGFRVEEQFGLTSFPLRAAIENGQVDIYSEYTGTAWAAYFKQTKNIYDPYELFNEVAKLDYEKNKIVWINMIPFNDTYAMAVRNEFAEKNNIRTLSDLAKFVNEGNKVIFGVNPEFYERADGFFAMAKAYGMDVPKKYVKTMEAGLTYEAVSAGKIDVAMVYSTDAKLLKYNLTVLKDDKSFFPLYNPAVLVREEVLNKYPEIKEILKPLTLYLNENIIIRLNYLVDVEGIEPEIVARNFLRGLGLIK